MTKPTKIDLRPMLPVAVKTKEKHGHVWMINGVEHNYISAVNKYGENWTGQPEPIAAQHKIFAKYQAGKNWLVAVFLPRECMFDYEQALKAERAASIHRAIEQFKP